MLFPIMIPWFSSDKNKVTDLSKDKESRKNQKEHKIWPENTCNILANVSVLMLAFFFSLLKNHYPLSFLSGLDFSELSLCLF